MKVVEVNFYNCRYLTTYFEPSGLLLESIDTLCLCKSLSGLPTAPWKWEFFNSDADKDFVEVNFLLLFFFSFYHSFYCTGFLPAR